MEKASEKDVKKILASSPAVIYACRAYGDFGATFVSDNIEERLGYTVEECLTIANFWRERIHPDDYNRTFENYDALFTHGQHVHEYRFQKKDGSYLWIHDEVRLIKDASGNPVELVGSWLDISLRKKTETALRKSEALFRDFFQTNPVATIITAPSGTVHMINPAFSELTGYSGDDVLGKTAQELQFWRDPKDREKMVKAIETNGCIDQLEGQFYGKNNLPMTCLVSSRGIDFRGEQAILSIVIDITEKKKAENALKKLDQAKSEFVATAAHELRTPLSTVMGFSEMLTSEELATALTEEQKVTILSDIQNNCERLDKIIDDLLDISRIEAGQDIPLDKEQHSISELIQKVVTRHQLHAQQTISLQIDKEFNSELLFDAYRIEQVIENLLNNAIKYSHDDSQVTIKVDTLDNYCQVTMSDTGIGMTQDQVKRIFERFYRAVSTDSGIAGFGLGMAIVKKIIEDHGGKIWVDSALGRGTNVRFVLP